VRQLVDRQRRAHLPLTQIPIQLAALPLQATTGAGLRPITPGEQMQEKEAGSWLARDGDGRVLEVDAGGYPGAEASPDDGRPVAEAEEPAREDLAGRPVPWVAGPELEAG